MVTKTTWEANDNTAKPVEFVRWAVMEINGHKVAVGYNTEERRNQVTDPIVAYSLKHKTATLATERAVKFVGDSGLDRDGVTAWEFYVAMNNLAKKPSQNITSKYE